MQSHQELTSMQRHTRIIVLRTGNLDSRNSAAIIEMLKLSNQKYGNVGLASHNRGASSHFSFVRTMQMGDRIGSRQTQHKQCYEGINNSKCKGASS
jgi:ABC-type lipoprotein export system ATPase subunit